MAVGPLAKVLAAENSTQGAMEEVMATHGLTAALAERFHGPAEAFATLTQAPMACSIQKGSRPLAKWSARCRVGFQLVYMPSDGL